MAIILIIKTEDGQVTELPLLNKTTMGRSSSSDFKIADNKMSGSHCSFEVTSQGQLLFTDLGSSNGSFLNNSQITKTIVRIRDVIRVGNTLIKLLETRLTPSERLAIGTSVTNQKNDKTLPELTAKKQPSESQDVEENGSPKKKVTVVLNQVHKVKKKTASNWNNAENVIDQEESSGHTKFLKLDKVGEKKKK